MVVKMLKIILFSIVIATTYGFPSKENYDKATIEDTNLNAVSPNKGEHISNYVVNNNNKPATNNVVKETTPSNEQVLGIQTSGNASVKPTHVGGPTFSRFIEDIFQIPITILQAVSNLITNPFRANKKTPETTISTY